MANNWWDGTPTPPPPTAPGYTPPTTGPFAPGAAGPTPGQPGGGPISGQHETPDGVWNPATNTYAPKGAPPQPGLTFNPMTGYWTGSPTAPPAATPPPAGGGSPAPTAAGIQGLQLGPPSAAPSLPDQSGNQPPDYTPPPAFQAPTIDQLMNDPNYAGFQFIQKQGQNAIQNAAAAKGTLNDSETFNALSDYAENSGLQYTQQQYQNALGTYNTNYATQYTDPYAINFQKQATKFSNAQTSWQDLYNSWLASNQLLQGEQGLVISGSNATNP